MIGAKQNLLGHDDAITSICVCQPYSIAVTISKDQTAIIWDLNRWVTTKLFDATHDHYSIQNKTMDLDYLINDVKL